MLFPTVGRLRAGLRDVLLRLVREAIIQYRECAADDDTCASVCDQVFPSSVYVHRRPSVRLSHSGFRVCAIRGVGATALDRGLEDEIRRTKRREKTSPIARAREDSLRYIYIYSSRARTSRTRVHTYV